MDSVFQLVLRKQDTQIMAADTIPPVMAATIQAAMVQATEEGITLTVAPIIHMAGTKGDKTI